MLGTSILVSLASLLVSLISFANQLVLAGLFGASMSMDAYLIAGSIPMLLAGVLSAALSYSLVPALISHKSDFISYRRFSGLLLIGLVVVSTIIATAGFVTTPSQIEMLGSSLSRAAEQDAILIARVSWITMGFTVVVGHLTAMHLAVRRFLLPVFASMLPVIAMILAGLIYAPTYGPRAVAWGLLIGVLLSIPVLLRYTFQSIDFSVRCLLLWKDVSGYLFRSPMIILAMLCFTAFQSIDAYWAPQVGIGNLAYLGYSQRILVAIGGLVIAGPAAVLLPRLAQAYAEGRIADLLHDTGRTVRTVIAVALPVAVYISLLAAPLVRLLFERGEFDRQATQGVAGVLPLMMTGMIGMLCVVIVFRALFSKHDIGRASMLGILATALYFVLSGLLSQQSGVKGIALAYASSWWLVLLLSGLSLWRGYMGMLFCRQNLVFAGKLAVLAGATSFVVAGGRLWIGESDLGVGLLTLKLSIVAALAAIVYLTVALRVLRIDEIRLLFTFLSAKFAFLTPRRTKAEPNREVSIINARD